MLRLTEGLGPGSKTRP